MVEHPRYRWLLSPGFLALPGLVFAAGCWLRAGGSPLARVSPAPLPGAPIVVRWAMRTNARCQTVISPDGTRFAVLVEPEPRVVCRRLHRWTLRRLPVRRRRPGDRLIAPVVEARRLGSGALLWRRRFPMRWSTAPSEIAVDGEQIYLTGQGRLRALAWGNGRLRWSSPTLAPSPHTMVVAPLVITTMGECKEIRQGNGAPFLGQLRQDTYPEIIPGPTGPVAPRWFPGGHREDSVIQDLPYRTRCQHRRQGRADPFIGVHEPSPSGLAPYDSTVDRWYICSQGWPPRPQLYALDREGVCHWERSNTEKPVPAGELVLAQCNDYAEPLCVALDARTGAERFTAPAAEMPIQAVAGPGWVAIRERGAAPAAPGVLVVRRARDGQELWRFPTRSSLQAAGAWFIWKQASGIRTVTLTCAEYQAQ